MVELTDGKSASINALITNHANANPQDYDITEFGFYGLDGNNNTVLFAIHRQTQPLSIRYQGRILHCLCDWFVGFASRKYDRYY